MDKTRKDMKEITAAQVRFLGLAYLVFACVLGLLVARKIHARLPTGWLDLPWQAHAAAAFMALGLLCLALGKRAGPVYLAWSWIGKVLSAFISPLVLGALYFAVVTPFALVYRFFRRDALGLGFDPAKATYWMEPEEKQTSRRRLLRQY